MRIEPETSDFKVKGLRCAGWLFRPDRAPRSPVIIIAHGVAAHRAFALPRFAERFVSEDWAVFLFDYRTVGDGEGEDRNMVTHWGKAEDWDAAIAHVRDLLGRDPGRIALWGTSFGGGAIASAARHADIAALVAQPPFADGPSTLASIELRNNILCAFAICRNLWSMMTAAPPYHAKAIARPGVFAAMNTPESFDGYASIIPPGAYWANKVPGRLCLSVATFSPFRLAGRVTCPSLLIGGTEDSLIATGMVERTARRMGNGSFIALQMNHFAPYSGKAFEENVGHQIAFLQETLDV